MYITNKHFQFQNHLTNLTILKYINVPVQHSNKVIQKMLLIKFKVEPADV